MVLDIPEIPVKPIHADCQLVRSDFTPLIVLKAYLSFEVPSIVVGESGRLPAQDCLSGGVLFVDVVKRFRGILDVVDHAIQIDARIAGVLRRGRRYLGCSLFARVGWAEFAGGPRKTA